MATANGDGDFPGGGDNFCQLFYLFIDGIYCMAIGIDTLILVMGILFDQVARFTEIEVTEEEDIFAAEEIVALDIKKSREKRCPGRVGAPYSIIGAHANIFGNAKYHIPCGGLTH